MDTAVAVTAFFGLLVALFLSANVALWWYANATAAGAGGGRGGSRHKKAASKKKMRREAMRRGTMQVLGD